MIVREELALLHWWSVPLQFVNWVYDVNPDALDEYLQIGEKTSRDAFQAFCKVIMDLYGDDFLRISTSDVEKLYAYNEEKHGFPRMLGGTDCTG